MDHSRRTKTNKAQYAKMVELAKQKPDIGKGLPLRPTDEIEEFWETLSQECNMLGPPIRDAFEWKKIWILWKVHVKRKLNKCVKRVTKKRMTHLEVEVVKMIKNPGNEIPPYAMPLTRPTANGKYCMANEHDLDESDNKDEECLTDSDDEDDEGPSKKRQRKQQYDDDPLVTFSGDDSDAEEEEVDTEKTLLQQQIDIQKNLCMETKEFQTNTTAALQDISLTLNTLRGGMKKIEDMNARSLREEMQLNRKTEELLQELVERDLIRGSRKK